MSTATDDRYKALEKAIKKLGYEKSSLLEVLNSAQGIFGYLGIDTLKFIAKRLQLPYSKVYGVATFYNNFKLKPKGRHNIVVCTGTACHIKGSEKILQKIEQRYGIKAGGTTSDEALSLLTARCVGTCSVAPVIVFDEQIKANVSLENPLCDIEESIK
ncbi:hypothetical protein M947_04795 [Sulfurimonas hongkongensis]|uniref:NADH dehydrogenase n=1 Tax=Sulfurimonas hongkongensis TaxID=1172190 RepID=T0JSF2_9BACT|nr:NAD(P)H-dependent oxidoreductase subunit E [Sulfurimonas hongkongensis]EQB39902.1 hypothetical protein M947_04795 [Sulfurimonas hongkongensis]